jgi:putative Mg2+ transporter-C (MgtC) family protein
MPPWRGIEQRAIGDFMAVGSWWVTFTESAFAHTLAGYAVSFFLAALIGLERQWRQRSAGLRTTAIVAVGAAAFSDLGLRLYGMDGATRIVAYVVSGIGFLGAGVILKDGAHIRGLNTAATLWCSAAVGALSGTGLYAEAAALAGFVLAGNTLLRPVVGWVNRLPLTPGVTEAKYAIHVICHPKDVADVRDLLDAELTKASYPVQEVKILAASETQLELAGVLLTATAENAELDAVVAALETSPLISSATWSAEAAS